MPSVVESPYEPQLPTSQSKLEKGAGKTAERPSDIDIIDIRRSSVEINLKEEIHRLLRPPEGPRRLPTLLLYDKTGLQLFEEITYLDEYYLTNHEIQVLRRSAAGIAKAIPSGALVLELGSGNLRKVSLVLRALEDAGKKIDYYALDLSEDELSRTLAQLPTFRHVRCHGLLGTYDDGREWLKRPQIASKRKCVLSLGSSIGNFHRDEAASFLKGFADVLQPADGFLIGLDSCTDPSKVYHAYNDQFGVTHRFILNGLVHANEILGHEAFDLNDWQVIGEYVYDNEGGRHQAFYSPLRDTVVLGETIKAHERVQVEQSLKYSKAGCSNLWRSAGMIEADRWMTNDEDYGLHLLTKPNMSFSPIPLEYARSHVPSISDFESLWAVWDIVTRRMLPDEELLEKPIKLRNACVFYLGHIPTFLDIQLTKTTKNPLTEPAFYSSIFERGIDPDVDNPELCHQHSEVPDEWPPLEDILEYQERVRDRLKSLYSVGLENIPRNVGRAIWVGFEHEIMHLETLLYMMLQSDKTLPPPLTKRPNFEALAQEAYASRVGNDWFDIPEQDITIGLDDPDDVLDSNKHFGWDNEKPSRRVHVHKFQAKGRPITNEEYALYMYNTKSTKIPASWANEDLDHANGTNGHVNGKVNGHTNGHTNGANGEQAVPSSFMEGKAVRTVYGLVPLKYALDWPVFASYDELTGCATWLGGRIPTFEEAQSIYTYVDSMKRKDEAERKLGKTVPAVNAHLVNDGVEETPPSDASLVEDGLSQNDDELFIDLTDANVGFHHWHPVAVTTHGNRLAGRAEMGGVWEWTSTTLRPHEGFKPLALYPGYTADFFDEKHNIVLGGSWATHPRIAGRKTFVNWYQRNYLYAWVGARLVRDL
ncbi:C-type lectin protein [Annulohypoxylon truncatum]|uniref:C-type lectin protein n=1 Tax=Annulohypoxylon truncatum TaxID=327061 RepID=UPI002007B617|nr:C-type lectin protein [Annulohypoxylon truncatum]KAI1205698.1 C-type lectin protein [Annulohypoxylon truncatum]